MTNCVAQYFKLSEDTPLKFGLSGTLSRDQGFFSFGKSIISYGKTTCGYRSRKVGKQLFDLKSQLAIESGQASLPFDPDEVVSNLTLERYRRHDPSSAAGFPNRFLREIYYAVRPVLPAKIRTQLQKTYLSRWSRIPFPSWPVDTTVDSLQRQLLCIGMKAAGLKSIPFIWFWPDRANAACVMTHDVEEEDGRLFCSTLMDLNDEYKIPASFQIVPEQRYQVTNSFIDEIRNRGFEVNIQDLNHDGRLYWDEREFRRRAEKINQYGRKFGAKGFRAAILYRKPEWFNLLNFEYDMSIPNVAHLDPQRGGCCTVMPYFIGEMVELPVTASQDHTVLHILKDYSLSLWKQQISKIFEHNGLANFIIHPDYIIEERARGIYRELLEHLIRLRVEENLWIACPNEVNQWWRNRAALSLKRKNGQWLIEGPESERARIAFANVEGDDIVYSLENNQPITVPFKSQYE